MRRGIGVAKLLVMALTFALLAVGGNLFAMDIGRTGISLNPPERGWKVEEHDDAALKVWHLRADSWDPPPKESGLIAVTLSYLDGDPWPDIATLRDRAADIVSSKLMTAVKNYNAFGVANGRFQIEGADFEGALNLISGGHKPASARLLVIRTGSGSVMITAFSVLPLNQKPFAALFGQKGILTAKGPGSVALNGSSAAAVSPEPAAAPPETQGSPAANPEINAPLEEMQQQFQAPTGSAN